MLAAVARSAARLGAPGSLPFPAAASVSERMLFFPLRRTCMHCAVILTGAHTGCVADWIPAVPLKITVLPTLSPQDEFSSCHS